MDKYPGRYVEAALFFVRSVWRERERLWLARVWLLCVNLGSWAREREIRSSAELHEGDINVVYEIEEVGC